MAPEGINGKLTKESDMWSVGIIIYVLLCGYPPFNGVDMRSIVQSILLSEIEFPTEDWT